MRYNENYLSARDTERQFIEVGDPLGPEVSLFKNLFIRRQLIILLFWLESRKQLLAFNFASKIFHLYTQRGWQNLY
jgi:hypothetical protein